MDTISRAAAIEAAKELLDCYGTNDISKEFADLAAERFMSRLPSAESDSLYTVTIDEGKLTWKTGVTRCKNCQYYEIAQLTRSGQDDRRYKPSVCTRGKYAVRRNENWFCADAERRTDED